MTERRSTWRGLLATVVWSKALPQHGFGLGSAQNIFISQMAQWFGSWLGVQRRDVPQRDMASPPSAMEGLAGSAGPRHAHSSVAEQLAEALAAPGRKKEKKNKQRTGSKKEKARRKRLRRAAALAATAMGADSSSSSSSSSSTPDARQTTRIRRLLRRSTEQAVILQAQLAESWTGEHGPSPWRAQQRQELLTAAQLRVAELTARTASAAIGQPQQEQSQGQQGQGQERGQSWEQQRWQQEGWQQQQQQRRQWTANPGSWSSSSSHQRQPPAQRAARKCRLCRT